MLFTDLVAEAELNHRTELTFLSSTHARKASSRLREMVTLITIGTRRRKVSETRGVAVRCWGRSNKETLCRFAELELLSLCNIFFHEWLWPRSELGICQHWPAIEAIWVATHYILLLLARVEKQDMHKDGFSQPFDTHRTKYERSGVPVFLEMIGIH